MGNARAESAQSGSARARHIVLLLGLVACALLVGRFVLLGADVPPWFAPHDLGLHLDDGYKTLPARNLVELGQMQWNPYDDYRGWAAGSPLMHWLYYQAYSIAGVRLVSVRVVGVLFFVALVTAFMVCFGRGYPRWALVTGVLLLSVEPMLYHLSRVALFEMPLAFFTALGFFGVFLTRGRSPLLQLALLVIAAGLATRLVKPSGVLYLAPATGMLLVLALARQPGRRAVRMMIILLCLSGIGLLLYETRGIWLFRIYLEDPTWFPRRLLTSGLQELSPLCMAAAFLCTIHGLSTRPREYLADGYRLALLSTFLGAPLLLALFETPPPRHYVAMMVSPPLLIIDHLARGPWHWSAKSPIPLWARIGVGLLCVLLAWYVLRSLDHAILRRIPVYVGDSPGILDATMYRYFGPVALVAFGAGYWLHSWIARPEVFRPALLVLGVSFVGFGLAEQIRTLASPTFDGEKVRQKLIEVTPADASVGGDWAPMLTLGTGRKTLYVNDWFNRAERFPLLRPDYFLFAGSWQDELNLEILTELDELSLGAPISLGFMLENEIWLYPLRYQEHPGDDATVEEP